MKRAIDRHGKIALQFSGGKDSLACLYLLKEYWPRLTVYHLNTGDQFPETIDIIERVRTEVPNFVEIKGEVHYVHAYFGIPSDLVPSSATRCGYDLGAHKNPLITDRYTCCFLSSMEPMRERMLADGVTLIIRGQKNSDKYKAETRTGSVIEGVEFLYPLEDWTKEDVLQFIADNRIEIPRFYESLDSMPDCMSCSAWWDDRRGAYLKRYHPQAYAIYQQRLSAIHDAVDRHVADFISESESC